MMEPAAPDGSDQILSTIINARKKIREVTHGLRDWMNQGGTSDRSRIARLQLLHRHTTRQLETQQLSSELAFLLFCGCADCIGRSSSSHLKDEDWEGILKRLLHLMKAQSAIIPLDKYQVTLSKVFLHFQLFL